MLILRQKIYLILYTLLENSTTRVAITKVQAYSGMCSLTVAQQQDGATVRWYNGTAKC